MKYRASGESPLLGKSDINDIGKGVNQWNRWRATTGTEPTSRMWPTILLANDINVNIAPGQHVAAWNILPWTPAWGESTQYLPLAVSPISQSSTQLVPAIAANYVEASRVGSFFVQGVCLAEVAAGEGDYGQMNGSLILDPTFTPGPIRLLGTPSTSSQTLLPVFLGSTPAGLAVIAKTPPTGIPGAALISGSYQWGAGACTLIDALTGDPILTETVQVYNIVAQPIGANVVIKATMVNGRYFVDVADCPDSPNTGPVEPNPIPALASVQINSPPNQIGTTDQEPVGFAGSAFDDLVGDISSQIDWSSNLDGAMGTGAAIQHTFVALGAHTVTASVTNTAGTSTDSIVVNIIAGPPPP